MYDVQKDTLVTNHNSPIHYEFQNHYPWDLAFQNYSDDTPTNYDMSFR